MQRYATKYVSITVNKHGTVSLVLLILETFIKAKSSFMQNRTYKRRTYMLQTILINTAKKKTASEFRNLDGRMMH